MISSLGSDEEQIFYAMKSGESGVQKQNESGFNKESLPLGKIKSLSDVNRYDLLLKSTCNRIIESNPTICSSDRTKVILSSTKANINALPKDTFESTRKTVRTTLKLKHDPLIISNACISGILAINTGADYIQHGLYDHVIVIGIDVLSDFITFGFQSLFAISDERTKPFDKDRKGISIGEASGAVVLSKYHFDNKFEVEYLGGSSSNDANHISGPSRTGEGLFRSVNKTFDRAYVKATDIDFISSHGTGTNYNDEMESFALDRLCLNKIPLNSMKGYFGHTLGAAGVIEVIISMKMMQHNCLLKSMGFDELGTSCEVNVLKENLETEVKTVLKTGSGFGGGNASLIIRK